MIICDMKPGRLRKGSCSRRKSATEVKTVVAVSSPLCSRAKLANTQTETRVGASHRRKMLMAVSSKTLHSRTSSLARMLRIMSRKRSSSPESLITLMAARSSVVAFMRTSRCSMICRISVWEALATRKLHTRRATMAPNPARKDHWTCCQRRNMERPIWRGRVRMFHMPMKLLTTLSTSTVTLLTSDPAPRCCLSPGERTSILLKMACFSALDSRMLSLPTRNVYCWMMAACESLASVSATT
mmetsp:Transcript_4515/g.10795  ORF Transcript_4515/g.10795 Transcript_4515/m.10795 type:complete len:242 (-) Transcript_4515:18-743(-)